jgi:hypothetical protein
LHTRHLCVTGHTLRERVMCFAHNACAALTAIHCVFGTPSLAYQLLFLLQLRKSNQTKWSGTILNIRRMARRAKYRTYFVKKPLSGIPPFSITAPALFYLPTSMLVACASRLKQVVITRSRRGNHLIFIPEN